MSGSAGVLDPDVALLHRYFLATEWRQGGDMCKCAGCAGYAALQRIADRLEGLALDARRWRAVKPYFFRTDGVVGHHTGQRCFDLSIPRGSVDDVESAVDRLGEAR